MNPYWGENYEFDILTGKELLYLDVFCKNELGEKLNFGKCEIELKSLLKDQLVHDEWIPINGETHVGG